MSHNKTGNPMTRREALRMVGGGFGMMAFAGMVNRSVAMAQGVSGVAKLDHPQRVKRVIFLFMNGGMSQVDTFDPKPMLKKHEGKAIGESAVSKRSQSSASSRRRSTSAAA